MGPAGKPACVHAHGHQPSGLVIGRLGDVVVVKRRAAQQVCLLGVLLHQALHPAVEPLHVPRCRLRLRRGQLVHIFHRHSQQLIAVTGQLRPIPGGEPLLGGQGVELVDRLHGLLRRAGRGNGGRRRRRGQARTRRQQTQSADEQDDPIFFHRFCSFSGPHATAGERA